MRWMQWPTSMLPSNRRVRVSSCEIIFLAQFSIFRVDHVIKRSKCSISITGLGLNILEYFWPKKFFWLFLVPERMVRKVNPIQKFFQFEKNER